MSVIIRLQNLPWSANALDIRNFFRGLSIPEGGVHIVGGELGDAFIAFSTDEDARQAMMLDGGKIKEIQVKLLLSSRSEMHKVIETARQSVPILALATPAPAVAAPSPAQIPLQTPSQVQPTPAVVTPFSAALGTVPLSNFGIPGIGNPQEIPQPAVIEAPAPLISPPLGLLHNGEEDREEEKPEKKGKDRRRTRSRSRSRDRERKERKRERRDRSRSRERRRRDRSRSREGGKRERKRDRKERSRSRDRSPSRRQRDRRSERNTPRESLEKSVEPNDLLLPPFAGPRHQGVPLLLQQAPMLPNGPAALMDQPQNRFSDPAMLEAFNKLQELGKKRNPNAFQGEQANGGPRFGGGPRGGGPFRRDARARFEGSQPDCCVAIRNAPNHTSYGDVRRFFPFMIDKHGIKMINDNTGRRTGNIFVRFCDPRSRQLALQRKANELKEVLVTVEELDDETYENAVDSFLPFRDDDSQEEPEDEELVSAFRVLKLAELPNFVKEHDIIKAFTDFPLLSIILNECRLSRSKVAYVQFAKPEDARLAYERKDLYMFGRRQPTVTPVGDEEFEKEKAAVAAEKGLEKQQQRRNEVAVEPTIPRDPRQRRQQNENSPRPPGAPLMQQQAPANQFFPNAPFAPQQAFGAPFASGPQFGGFPGAGAVDPRTAAANWANRPPFQGPPDKPVAAPPARLPSAGLDEQPLDCVLMKSLPREATDRTIVTFLSDTGAVPARIHLMLDSNGLPSGDCFCEFRSVQEARQAASKHGTNLEGCRVTVDLVSRKVVEDALEGPKQPEGPPMTPPQFFDHPRGGFGPRGLFRGRGGFERGGFDRGAFRGGFERGGFRGRGLPWPDRGRGGERGARGFDRGRARGFARGRGGFGENGAREGPSRPDEEADPALEGFGAPGCVVCLENVPYRATVEDLLAFFSDFQLTQDDIIRRYNERGQPTGDARVAFRTPFEAQRAVKERHMDTMYDRRLTLTVL